MHEQGNSLKPIIPSIGAVTHGVAKELDNIIRPLVGNSPHHIENTQHFNDHIKSIKPEEGECITSYDVKVLFISVPVESAISIIKRATTGQTTTIQDLHVYTRHHFIARILSKNAYFLFQGKYYEQVLGAVRGSPISPIDDNLFMECLKPRALALAHTHQDLWLRYVDDTFVIQKEEHNQQLLQHIKSLDPHIQFTAEIF